MSIVKNKIGALLLILTLIYNHVSLAQEDENTIYTVYFQSETSIMMETSKTIVEDLWQMMDQNPTTYIRLHGHTNGKPSGSYTRLGVHDTIFFKRANSHEVTSGSAKTLSYDRALTVKQYLVWKGIAADRIKVKGWGDKKQLYGENSRVAQKNRRVEVEVLEE
jgi:outer membrane protein OmpA-like peptidoglycan-associated protein